jgi:hypothetical protein
MTTAILLSIVSLAFGLFTIRAMRRHQLREQIAVLWILVSVVMLVLSVTYPLHLLDHAARSVGIRYGSDLLFFVAFLFLVVLVFSMSITISRLNIRTTRLAQELALLRERPDARRHEDHEEEPRLPAAGPLTENGSED